jgi:anti-sigma factor RsiW
MNAGFLSHISEDMLEMYALGRIPEVDLAPVEEHLQICLTCQIRLEEMDEYIKVMKAATAAVPFAVPSS